ncbi:MAG: hypothetical protein GXP53_08920 [Deltaproteobacteria bacterium]|nr:hypothetical protein [Deltaproteobacteria bacterium]
MHLLFVVIDDEDLLDDLITAWIDLGVSGATVIETTGALQLVTQHVPIFAGLRSLTSGGARHSKTIFAVIEDNLLLDRAIALLESICSRTSGTPQGIYCVTPVLRFGHLGADKNF